LVTDNAYDVNFAELPINRLEELNRVLITELKETIEILHGLTAEDGIEIERLKVEKGSEPYKSSNPVLLELEKKIENDRLEMEKWLEGVRTEVEPLREAEDGIEVERLRVEKGSEPYKSLNPVLLELEKSLERSQYDVHIKETNPTSFKNAPNNMSEQFNCMALGNNLSEEPRVGVSAPEILPVKPIVTLE
jgi:hypothetical protein